MSNLLTPASVELLLVKDVTVMPDNATIYNHPAVKVRTLLTAYFVPSHSLMIWVAFY